MERIWIQLLTHNNVWSSRYHIHRFSNYSSTSTDWSSIKLDFTEEFYGIRLYYDQIDTTHADMCFSYISITHSVY